MEPGSVVEALDEGEDIALGLGAGVVVAMMDDLGLRGMEEALQRGRCRSNRPCGSWMR